MRQRGIRLGLSLLLATLGLFAFAVPASASGETVGGCMAEVLEHHGEIHGDVNHEHVEIQVHHLHEEELQDELEGCFEAPSPILPELNEIIWGGGAF